MSAYIKRQIDSVEDSIYFLKRERNELHYQIYVCYRQELLYEYELTLKELDNQYCELKRLEKKYNIELKKERYKRADEELKRTLKTLTSQVERLVLLENEEKVKREMEVEHIEEAATEVSIEEVKQATEDPIEEVKQVEHTEVANEEQVKETKPQPDCFQTTEDPKVVDDIIEVEHIDFIIPEYLPKPPSLASQFSKFFASKPYFFKWKHFFFVPAQSCLALDFYKTRGRVFSNKGRMMRNGNKELKYMFIISLYLSSVEINDVLIFMFYMWG